MIPESHLPLTGREFGLTLRRDEYSCTKTFENLPHLVALFAEKYDGWDATDETQDGPRVLLEVPVDRWLLAGA